MKVVALGAPGTLGCWCRERAPDAEKETTGSAAAAASRTEGLASCRSQME